MRFHTSEIFNKIQSVWNNGFFRGHARACLLFMMLFAADFVDDQFNRSLDIYVCFYPISLHHSHPPIPPFTTPSRQLFVVAPCTKIWHSMSLCISNSIQLNWYSISKISHQFVPWKPRLNFNKSNCKTITRNSIRQSIRPCKDFLCYRQRQRQWRRQQHWPRCADFFLSFPLSMAYCMRQLNFNSK